MQFQPKDNVNKQSMGECTNYIHKALKLNTCPIQIYIVLKLEILYCVLWLDGDRLSPSQVPRKMEAST